MTKIAPLTVCVLLLMMLSTVFAEAAVSPVENYSVSNDESVATVDGNRVYVDDVNAYISATPHTLTADAYVYLNVTSKTYGGEIDFCFGFDSNLAYPKSLEVYNPRNETIQHVLNVTSYLADPDCKVDYNFTSGETSKVVYNGYIWVNRKSSYVDENNQTVSLEWTPVLAQHYDTGYPEAGVFYWNTTETLYWRSIRENWNFDKNAFRFKGMSTWYVAESAVEKYEEYYLRLWLTVVPTLDNATREFFVAIKPHGETLEQALASNRFYYLDPWYNDGWQYRKSHVINMASGAGTNYQVRVRVHSGSGTDSGENVYLSGKCRADFGDIRFTGSNGATLLDYWMEGITGSEAAFWVEIAEDLGSADRAIYVYYGNSIATTTSNFDDTFIFGDPFDSASLNTNRWPSVDGSPTYTINTADHYS